MARKFQRKASAERVAKVYAELKAEGVPVKNRIGRVAKRIGYTVVGAARSSAASDCSRTSTKVLEDTALHDARRLVQFHVGSRRAVKPRNTPDSH